MMNLEKALKDNPDLPREFVENALIAQAEKQAGQLENYHLGQNASSLGTRRADLHQGFEQDLKRR